MEEIKETKETQEYNKELNIYQRMAKATAEINRVAKNLQITLGKNSGYKAVGEGDVLRAVKPIEEKYGIYSYPYQRNVIESGELVKTTQSGESKKVFLRVMTVYRFVNVDNPTDYIDITTYGDGVDIEDKATGKAMTYSDKYALLKAYKIETGDDPDANASESYTGKETSAPLASEKQIGLIKNLYSENELQAMLQRMGKTMETLSLTEASKMIQARAGK